MKILLCFLNTVGKANLKIEMLYRNEMEQYQTFENGNIIMVILIN
jgi:hypothetical protein